MHKLPLRIYYEDTDAQGIVYHSKYLNFFERARAECLIEIGYRQEELLKEDIAFVVKKQEIEYFSPAKLDDEIVIKTILSSSKNVSFTFTQSANLKNDEKQVLCKGQVYCGCISLKGNAPAKIPEELRVKMKFLVQNND